jgi:hypothetical protein
MSIDMSQEIAMMTITVLVVPLVATLCLAAPMEADSFQIPNHIPPRISLYDEHNLKNHGESNSLQQHVRTQILFPSK